MTVPREGHQSTSRPARGWAGGDRGSPGGARLGRHLTGQRKLPWQYCLVRLRLHNPLSPSGKCLPLPLPCFGLPLLTRGCKPGSSVVAAAQVPSQSTSPRSLHPGPTDSQDKL